MIVIQIINALLGWLVINYAIGLIEAIILISGKEIKYHKEWRFFWLPFGYRLNHENGITEIYFGRLKKEKKGKSMKWNSPIEDPRPGHEKVVKKFAWWPRQVGSFKIWLEPYERVYRYQVKKRTVIAPGIYHTGEWGAWDLVEIKLCS